MGRGDRGGERAVLRFARIDQLRLGADLERSLVPTYIHALAFSPDGGSLLTGSTGGRVTGVTLWDLATEERRYFRSRGPIYAVAFSPDGQTLAAGGSPVRLWDVASGDRLHQLRGQRGSIYALAFSPDGKMLVTGSRLRRPLAVPNALMLWDAQKGTLITIIDTDRHGVTSVAFSPDGRQLAVGLLEANTKICGITYENVR